MLNITNNMPEALSLADLPGCLRILHSAYYYLSLRPYLSLTVGKGENRLSVGDELTTGSRWWARRPKGDQQRMLPFPGFARCRLKTCYLGQDNYFELEIVIPHRNDSCYQRCPRTLIYQPGGEVTRNTLSALRVHGLTAENILSLKSQLGWS